MYCLILVTMLLASVVANDPAWAASEVRVYDNTSVRVDPFGTGPAAGDQVGDEIVLEGGPATVTGFEFAYYGDFAADGDEAIRIRFYANDDLGRPGTLIYESDPVPIAPSADLVAGEIHGLSVSVPERFTFTQEFVGLAQDGGDIAFLTAFYPPSIGTLEDGFAWWLRPGAEAWSTLGRIEPWGYYARVTTAPEPAATPLAAAALVTLLTLAAPRGRAP